MQVSLNMEKATNKVTPIKKEPEEWEVQWERCKTIISKSYQIKILYNDD